MHSFIHFRYLYSAPSRFLLRGAPDYSADTESEFHAEAHDQLRVKDLLRIPTRRLEVDSNPQPSGCKAPKIPLHRRAPHSGARWPIGLSARPVTQRVRVRTSTQAVTNVGIYDKSFT